MKTPKYLALDALNASMYAERGNRCEACGRPLVANKSGEWAHVRSNTMRGEGRGRWERLHHVRDNPEDYKLYCSACHDKFDKRNYQRNIRALTPEVSSRAVKRALKRAGVKSTKLMKLCSIR